MESYTISKNAQFNSLEISFNGKPSEAVRTALKALKFRWHGVKKLWYGYAEEEAVRAAIDGQGGKEAAESPAVEAVNKYGVKVGDIFEMSWGYEQTNVDFFQVISLAGTTSVRVRQVQPVMVEENPTCGMAANRTYRITNDILPAHHSIFINDDEKGDLKRVNLSGYDNKPYIKISDHYARKCEEGTRTVYESWYY